MKLSSPADLRAQVLKYWDNGAYLASLIRCEEIFPLTLRLKKPSSRDYGKHFEEIREWINQLKKLECGGFTVEWKNVNLASIGNNRIPQQIKVQCPNDFLQITKKENEATLFLQLLNQTKVQNHSLVSYIEQYPLKLLQLADVWEKLLQVVGWVVSHPCPKIYLRQVDIPGIHSKFIEANREVLAKLLDLALPADEVMAEATGIRNFCTRYGFLDKPEHVRFRFLDYSLSPLEINRPHEMTLTRDDFADFQIKPRTVFIIENEINFLAFPLIKDAIAIWGKGYSGYSFYSAIDFMNKASIYYWGDIDTHGFDILERVRTHLPHTKSILMDKQIFLACKECWVTEEKQSTRNLTNLTPEEMELYNDLRNQIHGQNIRLEQEVVPEYFVDNMISIITKT